MSSSNSRIEQIIEEIEDYIDTCKGPVFSSGDKIIVERGRIEELLRELRMKTPEEVKRYQKVLASMPSEKCWRIRKQLWPMPRKEHRPSSIRRTFRTRRWSMSMK